MSQAALQADNDSQAAPQNATNGLKIWARRSSSSAQKVYWTLDELGVPHQQIDAGRTYGIVDTPEYLAKNPNGTIPTLEEADGFTLYESNAIIRYIAGKYGAPDFWPDDARVRADADRWVEWANSVLLPAVNPIFGKLVMKHGAPPEPGFVDAQIVKSKSAFIILSRRLKDRSYVAGEHLTFGDISLGMIVNRWFTLPIERPALPAIEAYYERLKTHPAYVANVVNAPPVV
jgi:glutathione S-transferase